MQKVLSVSVVGLLFLASGSVFAQDATQGSSAAGEIIHIWGPDPGFTQGSFVMWNEDVGYSFVVLADPDLGFEPWGVEAPSMMTARLVLQLATLSKGGSVFQLEFSGLVSFFGLNFYTPNSTWAIVFPD